jgi:hypothetical protein
LPLVLDPLAERVALLQLFGVRARHQPLASAPASSRPPAELLLHAQLSLGLPEPGWFLDPGRPLLDLAVLGSSGAPNERRWGAISLTPQAAGLLVLPRAAGLILDSLLDVQALQVWLEALAACCRQLLLLEPLADGVCRPPKSCPLAGTGDEEALLAQWEARCRG